MSIVERSALDFGAEHFRGTNAILEVAAGDNYVYTKNSVNPIVFDRTRSGQVYVLTDIEQGPDGVEQLKKQEPDFDKPGLTIRCEKADATKLSRFYRSFDAVFMRNFLGDPKISDDTKCEAIEESLLCLRSPKTIGASALWAVETYTPEVAELFIEKLLHAFPIFSVERAKVRSDESRRDPRFLRKNYPIDMRFNQDFIDIYKIMHSK